MGNDCVCYTEVQKPSFLSCDSTAEPSLTHWLFKALTVSFIIGISVQLCQRYSAPETEKEERLLPGDDVSPLL